MFAATVQEPLLVLVGLVLVLAALMLCLALVTGGEKLYEAHRRGMERVRRYDEGRR